MNFKLYTHQFNSCFDHGFINILVCLLIFMSFTIHVHGIDRLEFQSLSSTSWASNASSASSRSGSSSKSKSIDMIWFSSLRTWPTSRSFSQNSNASGEWVRCSKAVKIENITYHIVTNKCWNMKSTIFYKIPNGVLAKISKKQVILNRCLVTN